MIAQKNLPKDAWGIVATDDYVYLGHSKYTIDGDARNLTQFNHDGTINKVVETSATQVMSLATDGTDIYACGTGAGDTIFKYNSSLVEQWNYGANSSSWDIKLINSKVYVASSRGTDEDSDLGTVRKFSTSGSKELTIDTGGDARGVTVDSSSNVFVAGDLTHTDGGQVNNYHFAKYNSSGTRQWFNNVEGFTTGQQEIGQKIDLDNSQSNVYCASGNIRIARIFKFYDDYYQAKYDSTNDEFRIYEENDDTKTAYSCKVTHLANANKIAEIYSEIEDEVLKIKQRLDDPSGAGIFTTKQPVLMDKDYPLILVNDMIKLGSNLFVVGYNGTAESYDNFLKYDTDLTLVTSTETNVGGHEDNRAIEADGTSLFTGGDQSKIIKWNTSLSSSTTYSVGNFIKDIWWDGNFLHCVSTRGTDADAGAGAVRQLNNSLVRQWFYDLAGSANGLCVAVDGSGNVFIGHNRLSSPNDVTITKLNSSGTLVARYDTGDDVNAIYYNSQDGFIYAGNDDNATDEDTNEGIIRKLDTNLVNQWTVNTTNVSIHDVWRFDTDSADYIFVGTGKQSDGSLLKLNTDDGGLIYEADVMRMTDIKGLIINGNYIYAGYTGVGNNL